MTTLEFRGDLGRRVRIDVHGYEREHADNIDDANWLVCSASVEVGRFRGDVEATFRTYDFTRLSAELDRLLDHKVEAACFETLEQQLSIRIELDHAGRAVISGELRELDATVVLAFRFESDASFLRQVQPPLRRTVEEFPERR